MREVSHALGLRLRNMLRARSAVMSAGPRRDLGRGEPDRGYPLRVVRDQQLSHQVRRAQ